MDIQAKIKEAKDAGYSDDDIAGYLGKQPGYGLKMKMATDAGYKPAEILSYLSGQVEEKPRTEAAPSFSNLVKQSVAPAMSYTGADAMGGLVRGAGSIGATFARPFESAEENKARRNRLDENARTLLGANPESGVYQGFKLGAEIAGTGGIGNFLGKGAAAIGLPALAKALQTAGVGSSGVGNIVGDLALRTGAGAAVGGASAGLVNPEDAKTGAMIGGALPGVLQGVGLVGRKLGNMLRPDVASEVTESAKKARDLGYVIPPTQANPSMLNRLVEGYAGKISTAQNASAKNAEVTGELASKALGLPAGTKVSPEILDDVRKSAGQVYELVKGAGTIRPGAAYEKALDNIAAPYVKAAEGFPGAKPSPIIDMVNSLRSKEFDSSSAVAMLKTLREDATKAYAGGDKTTGKAIKSAANALEDAVESHLQSIGQPELLQSFRDARTLIAKTYSVEGAMNKATGSVDARKLAAQLQRGKPLSGELKDVAEFAGRYPKAAQTVENMGNLPQISPLDFAVGSIASAAHGNFLPLVGALAGRPLARKLALSDVLQNSLGRPQNQSRLVELLRNPEALQFLTRSAPVAITSQ